MSANRLRALLGIEQPIVLGPFGGASSVALTAAVSEAGGLGSYGMYGYAPERIAETASRLRAATARPFALNLWLATRDEITPADADLRAAREVTASLFAEVGADPAPLPTRFLPDVQLQLDAVLAARPAAMSVVFGVPDADTVERAHAAGVAVIGTATTVAEAVALEAGGVDVVVATGLEAGGHRVSFLKAALDSLVGTFALVPAVADAVSVPVVAAGGIADRRGVAAAFALGASGVQVGTAFMAATESTATPGYRAAIATASADDTVLTRAMSGRWARGVRNRAVAVIEESDAIAPFPAQNWLTGQFRTAAATLGRADLQSLWVGQGAPLTRPGAAAEVFAELTAGLPG